MKPDDTLALVLPNSVEMIAAYLAGTQIGCYVTPINHHLVGPEIAYIISDSEAKAVIGHERFAEPLGKALAELGDAAPPSFAIGDVPGCRPFEDLVGGQPDTPPAERVAGAPMHYTSGTTGKPKGVKRGRVDMAPEDLFSLYSLFLTLFGVQPYDDNVHITGSPLYHTAVLLWTSNSLHLGHKVVLMDKWSAEDMLRLIDEHRVTTSHMVPTQLSRLLSLPEEVRAKYDCTSTRCMVHAAAPCPPEVKRQMIAWWGDAVMEYYAATEGGGTIVTASEWIERPGHRRQGVGGCGDPHLRRRGQAARARRDRHHLHGAGPGDLRVQGRREEDPEQPHLRGRRLGVLHRRRRRRARRRGLPVPPRPQDRHDHQRRREHLPRRDRGRADHAPEGGRRRRLRHPPRRLGRGRHGRRRAGRRRRARATRGARGRRLREFRPGRSALAS